MSAVIEKISQNYVKLPTQRHLEPVPPSSVGTLVKVKGYTDLVCGVLVAVEPSLLYESPPMQFWHSVTGLHLSDASTIAPGFSHAIACMMFAIGLGNIIAAHSGPAAWPSVFASTLAWGLLSLLAALTAFSDTNEWGIANATMRNMG
ncbi:hypothetical protein VNI00_010872 [Paramarasmius palmivorus]|uniref:Uncharacterized protein n=1 Tax=Paramarasmius palmivorus TaxID=297713 RepID=A0AAW0CIB1_9AGAR